LAIKENKMDKLRVALISQYSPDSSCIRGGVEAATAYLVKGLARIEGLELHILTFRPPGWTKPDLFIQNGAYVHLLPLYPRFERLRNYRTYQSICNLALHQIQPAIVHAQEASADAYIAIRSGFPTVVTAHGIRREDMKYYRSLYRRLIGIYDSLWIEQYVMRNVRNLIAISTYITEYFSNLLRSELNIHIIPNAINELFFDLKDVEDSELTVLFAGSVIPRKRVIDLVQAFMRVVHQVPRARLRIAGEIDSETAYVGEVRRTIHEADLERQVDLMGPLPDLRIHQEFAHCSLLVLSSAQETTPMVLAQAMAAGRPVVATRVGGVAGMLGEKCERGLLVDPGDVEGLAIAMLTLLKDPSLRNRMGQAGHIYALENYHQDRVAQHTFEAYQQIAAQEHGSRA
jgi:glycosyltransferase involved in cell wall biosynthesis